MSKLGKMRNSNIYKDENQALRFEEAWGGFNIVKDTFDGKSWYTLCRIGFADEEFYGMTRNQCMEHVKSHIKSSFGIKNIDEYHINTAINYYEQKGMLVK